MPHQPTIEVIGRVAQLVTEYGWNGKEIARAAGVSYTVIYRLIDGTYCRVGDRVYTQIMAIDPASREQFEATRRYRPSAKFQEAVAPPPPPDPEPEVESLTSEEIELRDHQLARYAGKAWSSLELLALNLAVDGDDITWRHHALCRQVDAELFFPEKGGSNREAKRLCARCPVRTPCLEEALVNDESFGVWGGMSERERRQYRSRNHIRKAR